jgi:hypothetical protein
MPREKLPDWRPSITESVTHICETGAEFKLVVTVGFDGDGRAREVFCDSFKAGSDLQGVLMDVSILLSRLLQYGDPITDIVHSLSGGDRPTLVGTLARVTAKADSGAGGDRPSGSLGELRDAVAAAHPAHGGSKAAFAAAAWRWLEARVARHGPIIKPTYNDLTELYCLDDLAGGAP